MDVNHNKPLRLIKDYIYIMIGAAITGIVFNVFLSPNRIAAGGVSGISTILETFGFEPAYVQWIINIPLFIAGVIILGGKFGMKTLVGSIVLPLAVYLTRDLPAATTHELLAAIFGGVGIGTGIGIVYLGKGSTGGNGSGGADHSQIHGAVAGNVPCHHGRINCAERDARFRSGAGTVCDARGIYFKQND